MTKYEFPKDWRQLGSAFKATFHVSFRDFYDPKLSFIMNRFAINLDSFDDYLHARYGNYEDNGASMEDIIMENYGDTGLNIIQQLL